MATNRFSSAVCVALAISGLQSQALGNDLPDDIEVVWSDPPNGYIDVRADRDLAGTPQGISEITLWFNRAVELSVETIEVISTVGAIDVLAIEGDGAEWTIRLAEPIPPGESTILAIDGGRIMLSFHSRPGDVNLDGASDGDDARALRAVILSRQFFDEALDINRDGLVNQQDVIHLETILDGADGLTAWVGVVFPSLATGQCCCLVNFGCVVYAGGCPLGSVPGDCPCTSTSCDTASP